MLGYGENPLEKPYIREKIENAAVNRIGGNPIVLWNV
jgi:hypothetical protein